MSRNGAAAPPPGLSRESIPYKNATATTSTEGPSKTSSKPRNQQKPRQRRRKPKEQQGNDIPPPSAAAAAAAAATTPSTSTRTQQTPSSRSNRSAGRRRNNRQQYTPTPGKPIFKQHLDLDAMTSGLENGSLFRAKLRCNPGDRSQGFCTIPGLPHDVFIPDWKPQNRAIEGDEVVIQLLPLSEWRNQNTSQMTGGKGGGDRRRQSRGNRSSATPSRSNNGNIMPFGSSRKSFMTTSVMTSGDKGAGEEEEVTSRMPISTPITPATIEITLGDASQCVADEDSEEEVVSELISAPALVTSPSGGELNVSIDAHSPLGLGGVDNLEDEEEEHDISMVGFVTEKLQQTTLATPTTMNTANSNAPWAAATTPFEAVSTIASLLNNELQGWRATAEVVGIMQPSERRNTIVGVLKTFNSNTGGGNANNRDSFCLIPRDPRLPRCFLEQGALQRSFDKATVDMLLNEARQEEVTYRTLVTAKITNWEICHRHPFVRIDRIVGQAGGLDVEVEALLTQERIHDDDQFTPEVLACLPAVPWSISPVDVAQRRDLRSLRIFSIDPPTARDLDDALSIEELSNGLFRIGVHIADVSHFVTPSTPLDEEAAVRSTSVYLVDRVIPMLPRLLCEELCSLNPGVDRLAFSIIWEMDSTGEIQNTWTGKTIICSCGKLSYPQVQELIDGTATPEGPPATGVQLHGTAHSWADVASDALKLHSVASEMRRKRFEVDGALRLDNVRLYFELDDEGKAVEYGAYQQKESNRLVEEFMLAANMTAARIISSAFPDRALLRRHVPPNSTKLQELSSTVARLLPNAPVLDVSSAGTLQVSLAALRESVGREVAEVVTLMCTKPMQLAQYFCTGDYIDEPSAWKHYALAVGHYTHFTSPIRRYPDVLVHRLLQAALDKGKNDNVGDSSKETALLEGDKVSEIALHANERKAAAKAAQDGALKLYLASLLLNRPEVFKGVVIGLGGSRFFDVYIPALGIDVRVHTDRILKGGDAALNINWSDETKKLKIDVAPGKEKSKASLPAYDEVENFDKLHNPENIEKMKWPMELRALCFLPVVVCGARSKSSGSPAGVHAKIFV